MAKKKARVWFAAARGPARLYKRVSSSSLKSLGLSPKSERYKGPEGDVISKRQYQLQQLRDKGQPITLVERARRYLAGEWKYLTSGREKAARARRVQAQARARARRKLALKTGPLSDSEIARLNFLSTRRGMMNKEELEETGAFFDEYDFETIHPLISPDAVKKK